MQTKDHCLESVATFDELAGRYADKYFALDEYDRFYALLAARIPNAACMIDIACGPGNVCAYLARVRPDISAVGIDLAPGMIEQARARVPSARFQICDCRELQRLERKFQAASFAFGLSYLTDIDADRCFAGLNEVLDPCGTLLLSTITGEDAWSGYESSSSGARVFMVYRTAAQVLRLVESHGYRVDFNETVSSPANASAQTNDLVLLATKI